MIPDLLYRHLTKAENWQVQHISLLLEHGVKETESFTLESLWNASQMMARDKSLAYMNAQSCFLPKMDEFVAKKIGISSDKYEKELSEYKKFIIYRGKMEILYWDNKIQEIQTYTREKAIEELIAAKKLNEKIEVINTYLKRLEM